MIHENAVKRHRLLLITTKLARNMRKAVDLYIHVSKCRMMRVPFRALKNFSLRSRVSRIGCPGRLFNKALDAPDPK